MNNTYALILAGGSGTRFWPLSRNSRPKQLIRLLGEETLLQQAVKRMEGLIPAENILILTNPIQVEEVRAQAPQLPKGNIIAEPCRRDTGPAVALGIGLVAARNPRATMVVIPSDQLIRDEPAFCSLMTDAIKAGEKENALVTVGIKPTWPCPSYGYIERGARVDSSNLASLEHPCHKVKRFTEKPDEGTAMQFLEQGGFSWNAGMFIWSIETVMSQLEKHAPDLYEFAGEILRSNGDSEKLREIFPSLTPLSIDFALMEKADQVYNFEATFDWDDVGSWISVAKYLQQEEGNRANVPLTVTDAAGNIVFTESSGKRVALLGVEDLIVVDTPDAILVAEKTRADDIRRIVAQLPPELL